MAWTFYKADGSVTTSAVSADSATTATTATVATTVTITDNESTAENNVLTFVAGADADGGNVGLESDGNLHYNPSTGLLTSPAFAGALTGNVTGNTSGSSGSTTGNAVTASTAVNITVADTTDTTCFVGLWESVTGAQAPKSDAGLTYNAGTGTLTATAFAGPLTGNVTGNVSGSAGSATGNAANVTGTVAVANGGTGVTSLGSNVVTFLGTPSSANLRSALTDETGTGGAVFATSPTLVTPALGTPASGDLSNCTGAGVGLGLVIALS